MNDPIRILLVDDSPYFLEAAQIFLRYHNMIKLVDTASDSEEALAKAQALKPDLILLDLNLGNRSGLDLIPLFREHLPQTRIIVLTVMFEDAYRIAAMQAGADAFVPKNSMNTDLVPTILELMKPSSNGKPPDKSPGGDQPESQKNPATQTPSSPNKLSRFETAV